MKKLVAVFIGLLWAFAGVFHAVAEGTLPDYTSLYKAALESNDKVAMDAVRQQMPSALYPARQNGLWGYINFLGEWVIKPQWKAAGSFRNGIAVVSLVNWPEEGEPQDGIIDATGSYVVEPVYLMDEGYDGFYYGGKETGIICVMQDMPDGKMLVGFYDVPSGFFAKPQWNDVGGWLDDTDCRLIPVQETGGDGLYGYADRTTGELVLPYSWEGVDPAYFSDGWAQAETYDAVTNTSTYQFVNEQGKAMKLPKGISPNPDGEGFEESFAIIQNDATGLLGYVNTKGKAVIKPKYDEAEPFWQGRAVVLKDGVSMEIDPNGKVLVKEPALILPDNIWGANWDRSHFMDNGLAWFSENDDNISTLGLIDQNGRIVYKPVLEFNELEFEDRGDFAEGVQAVGLNGKWGYLDVNGQFVIQPSYDSAVNFTHGLAYVMLDRRMGYVDHYGHVVYMEEPLETQAP